MLKILYKPQHALQITFNVFQKTRDIVIILWLNTKPRLSTHYTPNCNWGSRNKVANGS